MPKQFANRSNTLLVAYVDRYAVLMSLALFVFFAFSLAIENGYRYGAYASIFLALAFHMSRLFLHLPALLPLSQGILMLAWTMTAYFLVACCLSFYHRETLVEIDQPSRYILSAIILSCISRLRLRANFIWLGFAVSALASGVFALIQVFHLGLERAEGYLNPIFFGEVSLLLCIISLVGLPLFKSQYIKALLCVAAMSALVASLLSGTRGGWIALPVLLLIYVLFNQHIKRRVIIIGLVSLIAALGMLYLVPQTGIATRIDNIVLEYQQSFGAIDYKSAIGHRIELWKAGIHLISERPLTGWGEAGLIAQKNAMIDQGLLSDTIRPYTHLHSLYLDRLARYGLIGLTTLLLIFLVPLRYFVQHVSQPKSKPYCLAGILLVSAYLVFSLTDVLLDSEIGLLTYNLMMITLVSLSHSTRNYKA